MEFDSITWAGAEGEYDGHPLLIRFREFSDDFPRARYPDRLNVFWEMVESDANAWPTESESKRLGTFEDRLVEAVEPDNQSILTVVLTCNGEREFVFQSVDAGVFLDRLTNIAQEAERYPITIRKNTDIEWNYFSSVTSRCR